MAFGDIRDANLRRVILSSLIGATMLFCELFHTRVRYTGISFGYQFSGIFAGGIAPIVATALLAQGGGQPWMICAYVLFAGVVGAICAFLIRPVQPQKLGA